MPYIGNIPAEKYAAFEVQHFTTSATTGYTLSHAVANENDIRLVINNVVQQPGASYAYVASGTTLTLSAATAGTDTMYCVFLGKAVQTVNPPAGSVGINELSASGTKDATTFLRGDNTFASAGITGIDSSADATAMTIDSSENVLVGKTSSNGATQGIELRANGNLLATRDGDWVQQVRRLTDDGDLVRYYKDSTQVGTIATNSGGISITLGGTGTANTLDDYEEGTFTPTISVVGATLNAVNSTYGSYTKIGSLVHVDFGAVVVTSSGTPSRYDAGNMPFQSNQNAIGSGYEYGHTGTMQVCNIDPNSTTVFMRKYSGGNIASAYLKMSITYQTSA